MITRKVIKTHGSESRGQETQSARMARHLFQNYVFRTSRSKLTTSRSRLQYNVSKIASFVSSVADDHGVWDLRQVLFS